MIEKNSYDRELIEKLAETEKVISNVARQYAAEKGIEYTDSVRRRISKILDDEDLENGTETKTNDYPDKDAVSFMPSAWDSKLNKFLTIDEFCDKYGLEKQNVKSSKLILHNQGNMTYNVVFNTPEEESLIDLEKNFEEIIQKFIVPIPTTAENENTNPDWFDRVVYTDVHIAMDVNGVNGDPMYEGKWDKEEVLQRLDKMINHIKTFQKSDTLYIDELGDFMDGLGGQTTRKGHELPQNMNDKEAFELALEFKIKLVGSLVNNYKYIICNDITNDNHSGVFSYFVSTAVKNILEQRYPEKVKVNTIKRFMEHYSVGGHTFILVHGKDSGENRYGMKPKLDAVQAEKIDQYCKEHKLYNGNLIELSKGDSHLALFDESTSKDFHYYNYGAFSPPSNWVKTNFGATKSNFRFFNIDKNSTLKIHIPYIF